MKFKYLLIQEDQSVKGTDKISALNIEEFEAGIINIVDCKNGRCLINSYTEEYEDIEEDIPLDFGNIKR